MAAPTAANRPTANQRRQLISRKRQPHFGVSENRREKVNVQTGPKAPHKVYYPFSRVVRTHSAERSPATEAATVRSRLKTSPGARGSARHTAPGGSASSSPPMTKTTSP